MSKTIERYKLSHSKESANHHKRATEQNIQVHVPQTKYRFLTFNDKKYILLSKKKTKYNSCLVNITFAIKKITTSVCP
jgi:hypothetical protein